MAVKVTRLLNVVDEALKYRGKVPYVYGGASPRGWDCSGFVNSVLGHDLGLTLPGGIRHFTGQSHGPVVVQYATWSGAVTVKGPPQAGDLCVFVGLGPLGHIGFAIDGTRMISALDPQYGTAVTPIVGYGPPGAPLVYRRIKGVGSDGSVPAAAQGQAAGNVAADLLLGAGVGLASVGLLVGILLAGAVLVGGGAVLLAGAISKGGN
jgi:hypothetical protein